MLYEVMRECNNYFIDKYEAGSFTIANGKIEPRPHVAENQYFLIKGSVFNDGVHKNDETLSLTDETFTGGISALKIEPAFLSLVKEIEKFQSENGGTSPYTSESFGGYSYTKNAEASTWQGAFKSRLNTWRKV